MLRSCLAVFVLLACAGGSVSCSRTADGQDSTPPDASVVSQSAPAPVTIEAVFGEWRNKYADLLGRPSDAAIEKFGRGFTNDRGILRWEANPATADRAVSVSLSSDDQSGVIQVIEVYAQPRENLDAIEVLKKSPLFKFDTGTYTDSVRSYLLAMTKDGRNGLQFDVSDSAVVFRAATFEDPAIKN